MKVEFNLIIGWHIMHVNIILAHIDDYYTSEYNSSTNISWTNSLVDTVASHILAGLIAQRLFAGITYSLAYNGLCNITEIICWHIILANIIPATYNNLVDTVATIIILIFCVTLKLLHQGTEV